MNNIWERLKPYKKILILGFGPEGKSTYSFIRKKDKERMLYIADVKDEVKNSTLTNGDEKVTFITGPTYLDGLSEYDCIMKTPGISLPAEFFENLEGKLTSQAGLFMDQYRTQVIGVTGTKGKSTTAAFIFHTLKNAGKPAVFLGNIGVPAFDMLEGIAPDTTIVYELSSHMLQGISASPHIALLLNLFPEHLDYYKTMEEYADAKARIFKFQTEGDLLLITGSDSAVQDLIKKHGTKAKIVIPGEEAEEKYGTKLNKDLRGSHILKNLSLAAAACSYVGISSEKIEEAFSTFKGLPHRLENVGTWKGVTFIDDSISTIAESAIEALNAYPDANILILGGMDRGISYEKLIKKILETPALAVLCIGDTGKAIYNELSGRGGAEKYFYFEDLAGAIEKSYELLSGKGGIAVLSPAAASFGQFKNFEERGEVFKNLAKKYGKTGSV